MKRIAFIIIVVFTTALSAVSVAAAARPNERFEQSSTRAASVAFPRISIPKASAPHVVSVPSSMAPTATGRKGTMLRRLSTTIVMDPRQYVFVGCTGWYIASWGGYEMNCGWEKLNWGQYVGDLVVFYYWDAAARCKREFMYGVRYLMQASFTFYPADRVCVA